MVFDTIRKLDSPSRMYHFIFGDSDTKSGWTEMLDAC